MGTVRRALSDLLRRARIASYQRGRRRDALNDSQLQDRAERREQGMPEGPFGNRFGPGSAPM